MAFRHPLIPQGLTPDAGAGPLREAAAAGGWNFPHDGALFRLLFCLAARAKGAGLQPAAPAAACPVLPPPGPLFFLLFYFALFRSLHSLLLPPHLTTAGRWAASLGSCLRALSGRWQAPQHSSPQRLQQLTESSKPGDLD